MEDTLISFETAKLAKDKGFKKVYCNAYYLENGQIIKNTIHRNLHLEFKNEYSAPTQSLLQRWLREVHDIPKSHHYFEYHIIRDNDHIISSVRSNNWEEILELGLQVGLKLTKNRR